MASHDEIMKGLDRIESPLVRQTMEFLISKVNNANGDEDYEIAKAAFVMYAHVAAPGLLREDINVEHALSKSAEVDEPSVNVEEEVKKLLAENGIYYFGPMSKHLRSGPKGTGYALPKPPHGERQENHGNRPGKRELIGYLADARAADPAKEKEIPRRVDMLKLKHKDLLRLAEKHLGKVTTSSAGNIVSAQPDSTGNTGSTVSNTPAPNATVLPGAGAGKNTTRADRAKVLARLKRRG